MKQASNYLISYFYFRLTCQRAAGEVVDRRLQQRYRVIASFQSIALEHMLLLLLLLGLNAVAARRQRDASGGQLQAPQAATVGGEVGGDVCPLQVCTAAEDTYSCSLVLRSGEERRACGRLRTDHTHKQRYVEGAQAQVLRHKCSVCGVSPTVHMLEPTPYSGGGG